MTALDLLNKWVGGSLTKDGLTTFDMLCVGLIEEAYKLGAEEALRQADSITWIHGDSISSLKGTIKLDEI